MLSAILTICCFGLFVSIIGVSVALRREGLGFLASVWGFVLLVSVMGIIFLGQTLNARQYWCSAQEGEWIGEMCFKDGEVIELSD